MTAPDYHAETDLAALDRLVVENDELSELELLIGRFNIFDALDITRVEIRHSNFFAWLLDPSESHGQGPLFLRAVLMDMLRESQQANRPFSPVELDGAQFRGVEVRREWRHIDVLITCQEPAFVVAIENKVESDEHSDQLRRYENEIARSFPGVPALRVFLTKDRSEASSEKWVSYGYADVHRVLDRCRRINEGSVGNEVLIFLDHYLRLIGSRFMDDAKIDELCQRIYRNHRQALNLIFERVGTPTARLVADLEDLVKSQADRWEICHRTDKEVSFVPRPWLEIFPAIGTKGADPRMWVRAGFWCGRNRSTIWCYGYPTTDAPLRRMVLERLTKDPGEFGLKNKRKEITSAWTSLSSEAFVSWPEEEEPDKEAVLAAAAKALDELWTRLEKTVAPLSAIFQIAQLPVSSNP
ncbi:MAG: hypothetical protein JWN24_531 [Phycisphaerales bacterium]|nr:hypothetical protein [Phycisphaerales bacterium]